MTARMPFTVENVYTPFTENRRPHPLPSHPNRTTRRHPVTRDRERRCRTHVPRTQEVRDFLTKLIPPATALTVEQMAHGIASNDRDFRKLRIRYLGWYRENCWEDLPNGSRRLGVTVTQRNKRVESYGDIAEDAIYHLRLVKREG